MLDKFLKKTFQKYYFNWAIVRYSGKCGLKRLGNYNIKKSNFSN